MKYCFHSFISSNSPYYPTVKSKICIKLYRPSEIIVFFKLKPGRGSKT